MTAAVVRSTPGLSIPQTQNTAPVLEFNCLYTHDLRRKQKRWQDGFLRYHTFNKRVMVYDVPRNFLGDLHWTEGGDLQEGDEITLEKGGIMVQVSEQVGRTETDLSELLHRKDKSSPAKNPSSPMLSRATPGGVTPRGAKNMGFTPIGVTFMGTTPRGNTSTAVSHRPQTSAAPTPVKHRSLNSLLGPSRGPIGKAALPAKSPFELRNGEQENQEWEAGREPKRQRIDSWNVTRTTKSPKPTSNGIDSSDRAKTGTTAKPSKQRPDSTQRTLEVTEIVDLSSDTESEQFPLTSSPPRLLSKSVSVDQVAIGSSRPSVRQSLAQNRAPIPTSQVAESPSVRHLQRKQASATINPQAAKRSRQPSPPTLQDSVTRSKSPPVSTKNSASASTARPVESPIFSTDPDSQRQGKALKLGGSAPKRMLVFQNQAQLSKVSKQPLTDRQRPLEERQQVSNRYVGGQKPHQVSPGPEIEQQSEPVSIHRQRLLDRLAQIGKNKKRTESSVLPSRESPDTEPVDLDITPPEEPSNPHIPSRATSTKSSTSPPKDTSPPNPATTSIRNNSRSSRAILHPQSREITPAINNQRKAPHRPSPSPQSRPVSPAAQEAAKAMPPPPRPYSNTANNNRRNSGKQAQTYNTRAQGLTGTMLAMPFKAPSARPKVSAANAASSSSPEIAVVKDDDLGPWSKEAFDFMDWRPPNRDAEGKLMVVETEKNKSGENERASRAGQRLGLSGGVDGPRVG